MRFLLVPALCLSLAACSEAAPPPSSSDSSGGGEVASLASVAPSASPSAPAERPLIRTDTSSAEEDRLYQIFIDCMVANGDPDYTLKHGAESGAAPAAVAAAREGGPGAEAKRKKARKACQDKEPEEIWQRAKRLDPAYPDKLRDWVTCVRSYGIDAWEDDGFLAFESLPPDPQMKKVDECQDKVFGTA
ncbi:hypothetical protein [Actinoplanes sp. RD1]|uniref:hypothetical protein n=1 Tax=Actinoplanes sp. RD1 TaxID=3064538 RepID=UPI002740AC1D|nr:hypothetical protein [Actinoplanes sp. RD1]